MKLLHALPALAAGALSFLVAAHGRAYCLTRSCDPRTTHCEIDAASCNQSGKVLFWANPCISYDVQKDGSPKLGIDYDTLHSVIDTAFQQWLNADCGSGTHPSFHMADLGPVTCAKPEYNKTEPNANVITFRDQDWPYVNAEDTVALTTVYFDGDTGEIYDANIEINSHLSTFAEGSPPGEFDLNAVLTHEAGHFLGLSHSNVMEATMYAAYDPDMATLETDDETAICLSLPPDRTLAADSCTPRHGFSTECGTPQTGCCATAVGVNATPAQTLGLFAFGFGFCAWRGRVRARLRRSARAPQR